MSQISANSHNLLVGIRTILKEDSNPIRDKNFKEIAARNPIINFVYKFHTFFHPTFISYLMVAIFGLKSLLGVSVARKEKSEILFSYEFINELWTSRFVRTCYGEEAVVNAKHSKFLIFSPSNLVLAIKLLLSSPGKLFKYVKLVKRINGKNSFMPACRAASTICYYFRFYHELEKGSFKGVLVAKSYSPDCIGLTKAAASLGIPSIFCPHSFIPPVAFEKPPLSFSLLLLQGESMHDILSSRGQINGKVVFRGLCSKYSPLDLDSLLASGMTIGVFLSGMMNVEGIKAHVAQLKQTFSPKKIIIRLHPVALVNDNLRPFFEDDQTIEFTFGTSLESDVERCNLVIVGTSGVLLETVRMGSPCVYVSTLETSGYDYNGFLAAGIVPEWPTGESISVDQIKHFYSDNWIEKFRKYDPFYGLDESSESLVREEISQLLEGQE